MASVQMTAALASKPYSAAGQATSTLLVMAILQVHQAKHSLCTRILLRLTSKVTARAPGRFGDAQIYLFAFLESSCSVL